MKQIFISNDQDSANIFNVDILLILLLTLEFLNGVAY